MTKYAVLTKNDLDELREVVRMLESGDADRIVAMPLTASKDQIEIAEKAVASRCP